MAWREVLLGLILVIVAYMVWLLWRMRALSRKKPSTHREFREPGVAEARSAPNPNAFLKAYRSAAEYDAEPEMRPDAADEASEESPVWSPKDASNLAQQTFMNGAGREIAQMRDEVDALRGALSALREDLAALQEEFQQESLASRTAQNASPLYNDAMQMAILGHDALTISERCGISRAEADLVTALVKNRHLAGAPPQNPV